MGYNFNRRFERRLAKRRFNRMKSIALREERIARWNDEEWVKKWAKSMNAKPNKPEQILIDLFKMYNLPYEYVGNFKKMIGRKNPDFIYQNKIIELFGDYWHSEKITKKNIGEHMDKRINYFKRRGYDCLIIWEHELDDDFTKLIEKIKIFTNISAQKIKNDTQRIMG